jgi:hypothetical protein
LPLAVTASDGPGRWHCDRDTQAGGLSRLQLEVTSTSGPAVAATGSATAAPWSVGGVPGLPAAGLMLKGSKRRTWLAAIWTGSVGEPPGDSLRRQRRRVAPASGIVTFKLKFTGSERGPLAGSNCQWASEGSLRIRVGEWGPGPVTLSLPARDRPGCGRIEFEGPGGLSPL